MTFSEKTRIVEGSPIDSGSKLFLLQEVKTQGVQVEACRQEYIYSLKLKNFLSVVFLFFSFRRPMRR